MNTDSAIFQKLVNRNV